MQKPPARGLRLKMRKEDAAAIFEFSENHTLEQTRVFMEGLGYVAHISAIGNFLTRERNWRARAGDNLPQIAEELRLIRNATVAVADAVWRLLRHDERKPSRSSLVRLSQAINLIKEIK